MSNDSSFRSAIEKMSSIVNSNSDNDNSDHSSPSTPKKQTDPTQKSNFPTDLIGARKELEEKLPEAAAELARLYPWTHWILTWLSFVVVLLLFIIVLCEHFTHKYYTFVNIGFGNNATKFYIVETGSNFSGTFSGFAVPPQVAGCAERTLEVCTRFPDPMKDFLWAGFFLFLGLNVLMLCVTIAYMPRDPGTEHKRWFTELDHVRESVSQHQKAVLGLWSYSLFALLPFAKLPIYPNGVERNLVNYLTLPNGGAGALSPENLNRGTFIACGIMGLIALILMFLRCAKREGNKLKKCLESSWKAKIRVENWLALGWVVVWFLINGIPSVIYSIQLLNRFELGLQAPLDASFSVSAAHSVLVLATATAVILFFFQEKEDKDKTPLQSATQSSSPRPGETTELTEVRGDRNHGDGDVGNRS